jgi:hypothetical protein
MLLDDGARDDEVSAARTVEPAEHDLDVAESE